MEQNEARADEASVSQQEKAKALRAERKGRGAQHHEGWRKGQQEDRAAQP